MRERRFDLAQEELDEGVARWPEDAGLRKCRADLRMQMDDREGAAADAAEAVILDRSDPAAKALLGIADARAQAPGGCDRLPRRGGCRRAGQSRLSAKVWPRRRKPRATPMRPLPRSIAGIAAAPARVQLRNAAILVSVRRRDFTTAVRLAEEGRIAGVADACLFGLKGHALSSLGRHAEAVEVLRRGPEARSRRSLCAASRGRLGRRARRRSAHRSSISAPCSMATPIASICTSYRLAIVSRA